MSRHMCENLAENEIRTEAIYHFYNGWNWFYVVTFVMFREAGNFARFLKIYSLSYNAEFWVWNPKQF